MKNNFIIILILISVTLSFSSCNTLKYVSDDEYLLTKNSVYVNTKKNVDTEITDYIVQRPNQLVLGMPFPLHFYNIGNKNFQTDYEQWKIEHPNTSKFITAIFSEKQTIGLHNFKKGSHQWFLNNGEAPIIFDKKKATQTTNNLMLHYYNEGYFNAKVNFEEIKSKRNKVAINYNISTGKPFTLDTITTNIASKVLDSIYTANKGKSFLENGKQFKYTLFFKEQNRINELFRNSGIYRFNKNAILIEADTANYKSNIDLIINDSIANVPFIVQKIKNINIYTDYSYNTKDEPIKDSLNYNGYLFLSQKKLKYNPKLLLESIFIEPNTIYKDKTRELTRKNLRRLNNFKTINIKYTELEDDYLEASIYLSPLKKYSIGTSTELTRSNVRRFGISEKISFSNLNVFKGAEILRFSVQGSFLDSKDAADNDNLLNAWEVGADINLELPRFLFPYNFKKIIPKSMEPQTIFTLGTSLQKNIGLDKQKFTGIIDYTWKSRTTKTHSFELLNAQFIKNLNIESYFDIYTSEYDDLVEIQENYFPDVELTENSAISFIENYIDETFETTYETQYKTAKNIEARYNIITEDVVIPSIAYTFTYNNSEDYKDTDFSFFKVRLASSGSLFTNISNQKDENNVKTLFNTPIAQYAKIDLEYKKFWNFYSENVLAFRSFLGIAVPYNNSNSIPFSRSYFIGGPNDLRAWKIYDLGPGSTKTGLEYNIGNLKFISSLEYRFKIINSIKGALFIDAGNIWDITDSDLTESDAKFSDFNSLKDIAIGSGFGIRYDLSFILLRLDLGFKTYEPYNTTDNKWFKNYNFKNNVYNFGISYPF
ncbi:outer membrane protein assembly factor [Lutibacter sp. A80]|uniref:translocation and assembly module lipoprotein TamL n=1 Tax=Lutibacter sp. A80 TaxID=2918453 RepID=UPI001F070B76|nr:BamA/TamA family outer membrane protein [Lutibacter sp. A80]UMB62086.1 outer membrane protein assembly factor [Lutibacter sp. A80]